MADASGASGSSMLSEHMKALKSVDKKTTLEAGWFESDRYPAGKGQKVGIPVAVVARIQENGATIKRGNKSFEIPARRFMSKAASDFEKARKEIQDKIAMKVVRGTLAPEKALGQLGEFMVGIIAKSIRDGGWTKNAPSTIKSKGFDKPLIDTAHMWKSVNSKVS